MLMILYPWYSCNPINVNVGLQLKLLFCLYENNMKMNFAFLPNDLINSIFTYFS